MGPHTSGSFSYKVINERIVKALDMRAQLNNTVQVAMPFVKATTTLELDEVLGKGSKGFTLGLHAIDKDVKHQDMFSENDSDMPLIGYTYTDNGTKLVYAKNRNDEYANTISRVFDLRTSLLTTSEDRKFTRIPPPGITQVTIGTARSGLLASAQLQIEVPSLVQLEALHRTFLIPGIGMVLEWGQQFAPENVSDQYGEPTNITNYMFPWHDKDELNKMLDHLAKKEVGLMDILEKHVYKTEGQYAWMFGRVANFSVKSNSDGSFNCTVKIIGPSEDSWAYSTQNTVVPAKDASSKVFCAEKTNSVYSYFAESTPQGPLNFKSLLDDTIAGKVPGWEGHVLILKQDPNKAGEPTKDETKPNASKKTFADSEDAYFLSWRFFVNVVLNDPNRGIKKIFYDAIPDEAPTISTLLPFAAGEDRTNTNVGQVKYLDDPMEPYVGMNKYLRSIDPSTMLLINEEAVQLAKQNPQYNMGTSDEQFFKETNEATQFKESVVGLFEKASGQEDRALLSSGVWLNHKAVVLSMLGGDTILRGITNLLNRMNRATLNYWELTIDVAEGSMEQRRSNNYTVVDANFKESANDAVSNFLEKVHLFNKYVRVDKDTGKLVGSELLDCVVDLSLPKRLFSQIATLGLVQPEDIQKVSDAGKTKEDLEAEAAAAKAAGEDYTNTNTPKLTDPNDTLREMFAITVISPTADGKQGPDLTILPKIKRKDAVAASSICGKANTQLTAEVAGQGHRPNDNSPDTNSNNVTREENEKRKAEAKEKLDSESCKQCDTCPPPKTLATETQETSKKLSELTIGQIQKLQSGPNRSVFAVGKYQGIPKTIASWVTSRNIPASAVFNAELQEQFADWLAADKLVNYFKGNTSLDTVQTQLAEIWAALPMPGPDGSKISRYQGDSAKNAAGATSGEFQKVLMDAFDTYRQGKTSTSVRLVKDFIGDLESNNKYDAINTGNAGDTRLYSEEYYKALNGKNATIPLDKKCSDDAYQKIGSSATALPTSPSPQNQFNLFANPLGTPTKPTANTALAAEQRDLEIKKGKEICIECGKYKSMYDQATIQLNENKKEVQSKEDLIKEATIKKYYGLQNTFRYVEIFPEYMVAQITGAANGNFANAFGASPGALSIKGDLTMPGIAGIRVGELFWIDRMPVFYKAFGAFQVMSIEDTISVDGWKTKIHAQFNFLGRKWKDAMASKLSRAN